MKYKYLFSVLCSTLILITIGVGLYSGYNFISKSRAVYNLPRSAIDIQEFYVDSGFTGNFTRLVKARFPLAYLKTYAKNLNLIKYSKVTQGLKNKAANLNYQGPKWWNPPSSTRYLYFEQTPGRKSIVAINWKDGHVYFIAFSW